MISGQPEISAVAVEPPASAPRLARAGDASPAVTLHVDALPLPADLLDGGEIIILAIRPSPWFVLLDSVRWLLVAGFLLAASSWLGGATAQLSQTIVVQAAALVAGGRMSVALLRWATRYYVLTNRRIMTIRGVLRPDIYVCPLLKIRSTRVSEAPHERLLNCGTLHFVINDPHAPDASWYSVAHPHEVHAEVRRAIERAIDSHPHT